MKNHIKLLTISAIVFSVLAWGSLMAAAQQKVLLTYKPQATKLNYSLMVSSKMRLDTHATSRWIFRNHKDLLDMAVEIRETGNGLLDVVTTFTKINERKYRGFAGGTHYKRSDLIGNSQHTKIDLLGNVKETEGAPHFGSRLFYGREDGPALDMYRVLLMTLPQFPLKRVGKGDTWRVKDKLALKEAKGHHGRGGIMPKSHKLDIKLNRDTQYTLADFAQRNGYRTARILFKSRFRANATSSEATGSSYKVMRGESSGEIYFALDRGMVVEIAMTSLNQENYTQDGQVVSYWLNPKTMIFLDLEDTTTPPLLWHNNQTVRFQLVK